MSTPRGRCGTARSGPMTVLGRCVVFHGGRLLAVLAACSVLAAGGLLVASETLRHRDAVRTEAAEQIAVLADRLEVALDRRLDEAETLAVIRSGLTEDSDRVFAAAVDNSADDVLFGAGVLRGTRIFDLRLPTLDAATRALLGVDDADEEGIDIGADGDASIGDFISRVISAGEVAVAGPIDIPVLGPILFGLHPAVSLDGSMPAEEGVLTLLRVEPLFRNAGLATAGFAYGDLTVQIRTRDNPTAQLLADLAGSTGLVYGAETAPGGAVTAAVDVPGIERDVYAAPSSGWPVIAPAVPMIAAMSVLAAVMVFILIRRRTSEAQRLQRRVDEATADLATTMAHERAVIDNAPVGIIDVAVDGTIQDANPVVAELVGQPREAVVGQPLQEFFPSVDPHAVTDTLSPHDVEFGERIVEVSGSAWSSGDDGSSGLTVALRDVTQIRREQELRDLHTRRLEELSAVRDDLLSKVSHELRTPITLIRGFGEMLVTRRDEMSPEQLEMAHEAINRHGDRLWAIINDLLTLSEHRTLPQAQRPVDVVETTRRVAAELELSVQCVGRGHALAAPVDAQQILRSLFTNAAKYGRAPLQVEVRTIDEAVVVQVSDHGPGIPSDFVDSLFEPFSQASAGDRRTATGLGIGLPVTRTLARRNGGDVILVSASGPTTFEVTLPLAQAPAVSKVPVGSS